MRRGGSSKHAFAQRHSEPSQEPDRGGPRYVHVALAYVIGAMLAKLMMVREPPPMIAPQSECGEVRQDQYGGKEILVGQSTALKAGSLKNILDRVDDGTIVLTFASQKYIPSLMNWVAQVEKHGITNYAIVCLDLEVATFLAEHKHRCGYILQGWKAGAWSVGGNNNCTEANAQPTVDTTLNMCKMTCEQDIDCKAITWQKLQKRCYICSGNYQVKAHDQSEIFIKRTTDTLWYQRWKLLLRLVNKNVHVLMSDLDAYFVRNPIPILREVAGQADIVAQRGSFPEVLAKKWGSALCTGFAYFRATDATKRFTANVHGMLLATGDDQVAVNEALEVAAMRWESPELLEFVTSKQTDFGVTNKGLRVALLPHNKFPRKCDEYSEADILTHSFVAHCFASGKHSESKVKQAQKYNLWGLRDDWDTQVGGYNTFSEYLDIIRLDESP